MILRDPYAYIISLISTGIMLEYVRVVSEDFVKHVRREDSGVVFETTNSIIYVTRKKSAGLFFCFGCVYGRIAGDDRCRLSDIALG